MRTGIGRVFVALAMLVMSGLAAARADVADADRNAIRGIISGQIEAFQRDDGATAYGYASPTIQGLFPTVDQFMAMVRSGYQPVYRPKSVTFGPAIETPARPRAARLRHRTGRTKLGGGLLAPEAVRRKLADQRLRTRRGRRAKRSERYARAGRSPSAKPSSVSAAKSS